MVAMEVQNVSQQIRRDVSGEISKGPALGKCPTAPAINRLDSLFGDFQSIFGIERSQPHVRYPQLRMGYGSGMSLASPSSLHSEVHVIPFCQVGSRERAKGSHDTRGSTCRQTYMAFDFRVG